MAQYGIGSPELLPVCCSVQADILSANAQVNRLYICSLSQCVLSDVLYLLSTLQHPQVFSLIFGTIVHIFCVYIVCIYTLIDISDIIHTHTVAMRELARWESPVWVHRHLGRGSVSFTKGFSSGIIHHYVQQGLRCGLTHMARCTSLATKEKVSVGATAVEDRLTLLC